MGGKDPACRSGFPWERQYWNEDLRAWFQKLALTRRATTALRRGDFLPLLVSDSPRCTHLPACIRMGLC